MSVSPFFLLGSKMAIAATIVVATSIIAEKSRPFIAAMVVTLPVSVGPTLVFLALDHDDAFMQTALLGSMVTNLAAVFFCVVYATVAQRAGTARSLGAALAAWAFAGIVLQGIEWSLIPAFLANGVLYALAIPLVRRFLTNELTVAPPRTWYAIPFRAAAVAGLVAIVTSLSWTLGPYFSGLLAVFPIVLSSLILILHPRIGGVQTAALIANSLTGLLGFSVAVGIAALAIEPLGRFWALALGLAVSILWNGVLVMTSQRKTRGMSYRSPP